MKKTLIILCLYLSSISYAQYENSPIENVTITLAEERYQEPGKPYKLVFTFDLIGSSNQIFNPEGWYAFVKKSDDLNAGSSFWTSWPIIGTGFFNKNNEIQGGKMLFDFSVTQISGGYRLVSSPVQLKDIYSDYPLGNYNIIIDRFIGSSNGFFTSVRNGNYVNYVLDNETKFNINDICSTCPILYQGHDNDNDNIFSINDNCPDVYNPDQLDMDNDGIGDVCDNDDDDDGVINENDRCPNEFGNASNFGCKGNPDLVIDIEKGRVIGDSFSQNNSLENVIDFKLRPAIFRFGGNITILNLTMKNIGYGGVHSFQGPTVDFYISTDSKLSNDDLHISNRTLNYSVGGPGRSSKKDVSIEGSDIGNRLPYGNYYLIIMIDSNNDLRGSELSRDNNAVYIPINYTGILQSGKISINVGNSVIKVPINDSKSNLKIYDINNSSSALINQNISQGDNLNLYLQPSIYAIYVNDRYIKKVKVKSSPVLFSR